MHKKITFGDNHKRFSVFGKVFYTLPYHKKLFLILFIGSLALFPVLVFHKSHTPELGRWSYNYAILIFAYIIWVCYCALSYFSGSIHSLKYILMFLAAFIIADYFLGSYYSIWSKIKPHPIYHHCLLPGTHRIATPEYKYKTYINPFGLRYKRIPLQKPKNTFRAIVLGDSFAEGKGVGDKETFCYLLENKLNQEKSYTGQYQILNAGVDSFAPILEYLYLKTDGVKLNPDLVILFFDMSDLEQTPVYWSLAVKNSNGEIIRIPHTRIENKGMNIYYYLRTRFYYLGGVINNIRDRFDKKSSGEKIIEQPNTDLLKYTLSAQQKDFADKWNQVYSDINLIKTFCGQNHIKFMLVIYPWGHQAGADEWEKGRRNFGIENNYLAPDGLSYMIEDWAKQNNINILNLFPSFRNYSGKDKLYYDFDPHWTKYGHKLVFEGLYNFLKSNDVLLKK